MADARALGFDEASTANVAAALDGDAGSEDAAVWSVNVDAVNAFLAIATQWRTLLVPHGFGVRSVAVGLDYVAAERGLALAGIDVTPDLWARLKVMEGAAAAALNGN
jgi:hypothetical protein